MRRTNVRPQQKGKRMVRYLTLLRFTEQGMKTVKKSTSRAASFRETAEKAGVLVEVQYWTAGSHDGATNAPARY